MITHKCDCAVLLIAFNRPENTQKVLNEILKSNPRIVYVSVDGPRNNNLNDKVNCQEVRDIVERTLCNSLTKYKILFQEENLGCKMGVYSAINWFFENETEGIILEDDTLPNSSFFKFCEQMLIKYRENTRIGMVCGSNLIKETYNNKSSYFFSEQTPIWGWATWKRVWEKYDLNMSHWDQSISKFKSVPSILNYREKLWNSIFFKVLNNEIDTWDYQWTFSFWKNDFFSIIPSNNLIKNIGFGDNATHTNHKEPQYSINLIPTEMNFPILHPNDIDINNKFDRLVEKNVYKINFFTFLKTNYLHKKSFSIFFKYFNKSFFIKN